MALVLIVARGPDAGARLVVDANAKVIGRSRSSDLVLTDPGVSRSHLEVQLAGDRVVVRSASGAAPFVASGIESREASLAIGESIVLANTVLAVAPPATSTGASEATMQPTALRGLLQGLAADVKSLLSITELVEALDACADMPALSHAVASWANVHADGGTARLIDGSALQADVDLAPLSQSDASVVVVDRGPSGARIAVAVHGLSPAAMIVDLPIAKERVRPELVRLLGVAGRIVGSSFARITHRAALEEENASLRTLALGSARAFLGDSPAAAEVSRLVQRLAASDVSALVLGESGTGKSFVARLVHEASARAREPFRVINCAAIPENLVESELFGHERGAFSGAVASHAGAFEAVGRGTIFLDEIGDLSLASQAKLLRVLEERRFERVGSNKSLVMQARVLAATNRDLGAMVQDGRFRQDLFFRVSVVSIRVPPLRDRGDDVVVLANRVLADAIASNAGGRRVSGFAPEAVRALRAYSWPGNVRELRNAIEHALVLGDGPIITPADLPETVRGGAATPSIEGDTVRLPARLDWLEERAIEAALRTTGGNRTKAAALLGINRVTLYKKLKEDDTGS